VALSASARASFCSIDAMVDSSAPHTPLPRSVVAPAPISKRGSVIGSSGHSTCSAARAAIWRDDFLLL